MGHNLSYPPLRTYGGLMVRGAMGSPPDHVVQIYALAGTFCSVLG